MQPGPRERRRECLELLGDRRDARDPQHQHDDDVGAERQQHLAPVRPRAVLGAPATLARPVLVLQGDVPGRASRDRGSRRPFAEAGHRSSGRERVPHLDQRQHRARGRERGQDVRELDGNVVRDRELHDRECHSRGQRRRPRLAQALAPVGNEHEDERNDHGQERGLAADHRSQGVSR